ncbi:MAG: hypothetical protein LBV04_01910 [Deferribacteraceae bacterium]|nr:hypothetical protein [Deferribacteraceae bacterium]
MDIMSETIVKEYGIQVILTTHSPSTLQYSSEGSVFVMNSSSPRIQKVNKTEAISILSSGRVSISEDNAMLMLENAIKDKPILCVEGITDKMILDCAWNKLYPSMPMPFSIQPCFDCYFIINMFLLEDVFRNNSNVCLIGLLDYDDAYKTWKEKCKEKYQKNGEYWKNQSYNGFVLTIPVPENRKSYAGENITGSQLSIELLFSDEMIEKYCENIPMAGGGSLLKFQDKHKPKFAKNIIALKNDDFCNFKELFSNIQAILEQVKSA